MKNYFFILVFFLFFFNCSKSDSHYNITNPENNQNAPSEKYISLDPLITFQTVDGFGGGIKRRTEDLYALDDALRQKIEALCFRDLEINMIRFFVYHDLEPVNDNNDPNNLDESKLDWTRYDSGTTWRSFFIGEALNNAFDLSTNGFDHIIGNCNSAPSWLKTNGQHNNGGTLIPGGEEEYSEFLIAFLKGMKSRYNIDVTEISPTNEPDFEVSYESMNTTPEELSNILTTLDTRLTNASLDHVNIISPECFRVSPNSNNSQRSAAIYINSMFTNPDVASSVDIVATHTYADNNHIADWDRLKTAASGKNVWVTESANLGSNDISMTDASNYVKWMIRGFNEGNLTAYMTHLLYEEADDSYSSLVAWTPSGQIILPKRYFVLKHFANLVKKGYKRIKHVKIDADLFVTAFKSPDDSKVVVQMFNESADQDITIDVPNGTQFIEHFVTSEADLEEFKEDNNLSFNVGDNYITTTIKTMSMHTFVYNINN